MRIENHNNGLNILYKYKGGKREFVPKPLKGPKTQILKESPSKSRTKVIFSQLLQKKNVCT